MRPPPAETEIDIDGRRLRLTNRDRVLWPETGFTKGQMIDYYRAVARWLVPHVGGRPVTLARFPMGVHDKGWYQTNCRGAPDWMAVAEVAGRHGQTFRMCRIEDPVSLVWVANQGTVELHPLLATVDAPEEAALLAFDLDPAPPAGLAECCRVALRLGELLAADGLAAWPKTSGSVGLHLFVPLATGVPFATARGYARTLAERLTDELPALVTATVSGSSRAGRVLIDWRQNEPMRSMIAPYSLRATPWPLVSTPLEWREVDEVAAGADERRVMFGPPDVLARLDEYGDLFAGVLTEAYVLPGLQSGDDPDRRAAPSGHPPA